MEKWSTACSVLKNLNKTGRFKLQLGITRYELYITHYLDTKKESYQNKHGHGQVTFGYIRMVSLIFLPRCLILV